MLGISNDAWIASGTIIGAVGTVATPFAGWALAAVRAKHVAEMAAIKTAASTDLDKVKSEMEAAIKDVATAAASAVKDVSADVSSMAKQNELNAASLKAAWVVIDDLRINGVRRVDQDRLREEFRSDMKALGDRLVAELTALRADIHNRPQGGA